MRITGNSSDVVDHWPNKWRWSAWNSDGASVIASISPSLFARRFCAGCAQNASRSAWSLRCFATSSATLSFESSWKYRTRSRSDRTCFSMRSAHAFTAWHAAMATLLCRSYSAHSSKQKDTRCQNACRAQRDAAARLLRAYP